MRRIDPAVSSVPPVFSMRGQLGRDAAFRYQDGEVRRVLRSGGRFGLTLWRDPSASPYSAAVIEAVALRLGPDAADGLVARFRLADPAPLVTALAMAGVTEVETRRIDLILDLPPLADWEPRHLAAIPVASARGGAPSLARELVALAKGWPST